MMANKKTEIDESQLHLDAMLYVLEDPTLDRRAFEARLEDNSQLAEILADAVAFCLLTSNVTWDQHSTLLQPAIAPTALITYPVLGWRWVGTLSTLAASFLIVVFLCWQAFQHKNPGSPEFAYTNAETVSLNNVVLAWGDMQSEHSPFQSGRELVDFESESSLAILDSVGERDVPEWLVLATSDTLNHGLELSDGEGLLQ